MQGETGGRGRRARRRAVQQRSGLGPLVAWVVFTLVMSAVVLLLVGVQPTTVAWLVAAGTVVGAVLVGAFLVSPPPPIPGRPADADPDP